MDRATRANAAAIAALLLLAVAYPTWKAANAPPYDAPAWMSQLYALAFLLGWGAALFAAVLWTRLPREDRTRALPALVLGSLGTASLVLFVVVAVAWAGMGLVFSGGGGESCQADDYARLETDETVSAEVVGEIHSRHGWTVVVENAAWMSAERTAGRVHASAGLGQGIPGGQDHVIATYGVTIRASGDRAALEGLSVEDVARDVLAEVRALATWRESPRGGIQIHECIHGD